MWWMSLDEPSCINDSGTKSSDTQYLTSYQLSHKLLVTQLVQHHTEDVKAIPTYISPLILNLDAIL